MSNKFNFQLEAALAKCNETDTVDYILRTDSISLEEENFLRTLGIRTTMGSIHTGCSTKEQLNKLSELSYVICIEGSRKLYSE